MGKTGLLIECGRELKTKRQLARDLLEEIAWIMAHDEEWLVSTFIRARVLATGKSKPGATVWINTAEAARLTGYKKEWLRDNRELLHAMKQGESKQSPLMFDQAELEDLMERGRLNTEWLRRRKRGEVI